MLAFWKTLNAQQRGLIWMGVAAHFLLALILQLSPDEAHYALYANHPAWSYFDHPPLVGWLQIPAVWLGGHDLALRVVPMMCWLLSIVGMAKLAHELTGNMSMVTMVILLLMLSPLHHLLGIALVPDTLLLALTVAAMFLVWRLRVPSAAHKLRLWLLLGICMGLTGLAKYTGIFLALSTLAYLVLTYRLKLLSFPGFWLAMLLALVMITPVLYWNAQHDWISFAYQLDHADGKGHWLLRRSVLYVLAQVLSYGALLAAGWYFALRAKPSPARTISIVFGLPPLLLFIYMAGNGRALPHWTAPAWLAMLPMAALGVQRLVNQFDTRWFKGLRALQVLILAAVAGLLISGGPAAESGSQIRAMPGQRGMAPSNPIADLYGWRDAAERAKELAAQHGAQHLAVTNWSLASRISWYARPMSVWVLDDHRDQFNIWFGRPMQGASAIVVDWSLMTFAQPVAPDKFAGCERLEQQATQHLGRQLAHFNFMLCKDWQGSPSTGLAFLSSSVVQPKK